MKLTQAPYSKPLLVTQISDATLEIKLLELGFGINSECNLLRQAPFNGPYTLNNEKTQIILRSEDANRIEVSILPRG
jgi:Fe2+ transport system protein FeoA